ncbi:glycosyltransferase [Myxococcota bacterium]
MSSVRVAVQEQENAEFPVPEVEMLRRVAWQIASNRPHERYQAPSLVTLSMASPSHGLITWRVSSESIERVANGRSQRWHGRRLVIRLYDVTLVDFDGFNANAIRDFPVDRMGGEMMIGVGAPGTVQMAEVGFLLHDGEFAPMARSQPVAFPSGSASPHQDPSALFVDARLRPEPVPSVWEAARWLKRRQLPVLRVPLRVALLSWESKVLGNSTSSAAFVDELARELAAHGHEVHVLVPAGPQLSASRHMDGVQYHPLWFDCGLGPTENAGAFRRAAEAELARLGRFDLWHWHEWMAAVGPVVGGPPTLASLSSVESTRVGPGPMTDFSRSIQAAERAACAGADCVLLPEPVRPCAEAELLLEPARVVAFPLEGRFLDEWECPLDVGRVKQDFGLGPLDQMVLYVGPLEWSGGPDLLVEAMPALLNRSSACRLAFVGLGSMRDALERRAHELGVARAVRWIGHLEGPPLVRIVRAAEGLALPARQREPWHDGVVSLARRAGRPVATTTQGPTHLVQHDVTGLVTYDNPGSMVWAIGQLLCDAYHSEWLGTMGRISTDQRPQWAEVAALYADVCAVFWPELTEGWRS